MDEKRIERALRQGPPDEPAYRPALDERLVAHVGRVPDQDEGQPWGSVRRIQVRTRPGPVTEGWRPAWVVVAGLVILVAVTFLLRFALPETPPAAEDDLLSRLTATGQVRFVVSNAPPQALAAGGAYIGFDVDVAEEVAAALGLRAAVSARPPEAIVAAADEWDIGLPSRALDLQRHGLSASQPYYAWPAWLAVAADSPVSGIDELAGETICAVSHSAGADWLLGRAVATVEVIAQPPAQAAVVERDDDSGCIAAILEGQASAAVTASLLDEELAGSGLRPLQAAPVLREPRSVVVVGTGPEVRTMIEAIDQVLEELRSSGRLAELSRRSFGGREMTESTR